MDPQQHSMQNPYPMQSPLPRQPYPGGMQGMPGQMAQQDPLAELRDIVSPKAIEQWPPAFGWWILLVLIIAALGASSYAIIRHWKINRYRKAANQCLLDSYKSFQHHGDQQQYLMEYSQILKRTALTRFPREQVASLTGEQWLSFLDQTMKSNEFSSGVGKSIVTAPYQTSCDIDIKPIHTLGLKWIKKHKPSKNPFSSMTKEA